MINYCDLTRKPHPIILPIMINVTYKNIFKILKQIYGMVIELVTFNFVRVITIIYSAQKLKKSQIRL